MSNRRQTFIPTTHTAWASIFAALEAVVKVARLASFDGKRRTR